MFVLLSIHPSIYLEEKKTFLGLSTASVFFVMIYKLFLGQTSEIGYIAVQRERL